MEISLVIPSLDTPTLPRTLASVAAMTRQPREIIVVGRDTRGALQAFPGVRFVDTGQPVCAAAARNRGIETASGDVIAFLDADCIPHPEWLGRLERRLDAGEDVAGGSVALAGSNYWAQSDNVSMFHHFVPDLPAGYRALLPTLNLAVRRRVVEKVGLLDESFPGAAAEDADWTIRMRRAGFQLFFEPAAPVQHAPARTTWPDVVRHWRNLGYNAVRVRIRYRQFLKTPGLADNAIWWRVLAPLIAARVTLGIYANPHFWRYWRSLPVVYASKVIYCLGAAEAIDSGDAFQ